MTRQELLAYDVEKPLPQEVRQQIDINYQCQKRVEDLNDIVSKLTEWQKDTSTYNNVIKDLYDRIKTEACKFEVGKCVC